MTTEIPDGFLRTATAADNANIAKVLNSSTTMPDIAPVPADEVTLCGGLLRPDGTVVSKAIVRELTGAHEEAIARARTGGSVVRIIMALVESGTASIGGEGVTRDLLLRLLAGDWITLVLKIRIATYGSSFEIEGVQCPHCSGVFDVQINLDEVPHRSLKDPVADRTFVVDLRNGRRARVRLSTGADQEAIYAKPNLTQAERNSIVLQRAVTHVIEADGTERDLSFDNFYVRNSMSIPDRRTIIDALSAREVGPQLDTLTLTHTDCGQEVPFPLEVGDLFRDL